MGKRPGNTSPLPPRCLESLTNAEMNANEKLYLPVDGISSAFCPHRFTHPRLQNTNHSPNRPTPPPPPPPAPANPKPAVNVSTISKTGMGIVRSVKGRWRQQEKTVVTSRSLSVGKRQASAERLPRRSVDLLELGLTKPKNCQRVVVLGAPRVGKTNIVHRFLGKDFEEGYQPTTEDFHRKLYYIRGETYQVDLLDAAKERDFPAKRRLSILTGDIFLLVFSLEDRESFAEVCELMSEIEEAKTKLLKVKHASRVPVVICGNKADLDARRTVSRSEVRRALGKDAAVFETSAKDGTGLEAAFRAVAGLSGLPHQTSPSKHQLVSIFAYQALCNGHRRGRGRGAGHRSRERGAPCAAVDPLARRPSFTSDLRLVLGSSTKHKSEKCQIQ